MTTTQRISLMGQTSITGTVTPSTLVAGGLQVVDEDGEVHHIGPSAVYRVWPPEPDPSTAAGAKDLEIDRLRRALAEATGRANQYGCIAKSTSEQLGRLRGACVAALDTNSTGPLGVVRGIIDDGADDDLPF